MASYFSLPMLIKDRQRKVTKRKGTPITRPLKNRGYPLCGTVNGAAAELAIKNMAQTVLADNSPFTTPPNGSLKGVDLRAAPGA